GSCADCRRSSACRSCSPTCTSCPPTRRPTSCTCPRGRSSPAAPSVVRPWHVPCAMPGPTTREPPGRLLRLTLEATTSRREAEDEQGRGPHRYLAPARRPARDRTDARGP